MSLEFSQLASFNIFTALCVFSLSSYQLIREAGAQSDDSIVKISALLTIATHFLSREFYCSQQSSRAFCEL